MFYGFRGTLSTSSLPKLCSRPHLDATTLAMYIYMQNCHAYAQHWPVRVICLLTRKYGQKLTVKQYCNYILRES